MARMLAVSKVVRLVLRMDKHMVGWKVENWVVRLADLKVVPLEISMVGKTAAKMAEPTVVRMAATTVESTAA